MNYESIVVERAIELLHRHSCFKNIDESIIMKIINTGQIINVNSDDIIVKKNQPVTSFYIIINGSAAVYSQTKNIQLDFPAALLGVGESIGLAASGLFSKTGKRTATVIAKTKMTLLKVDLNQFIDFLNYSEDPELTKVFFSDLLRVDFLKKISPFHHFTPDETSWLNERVKEKIFIQNEIIFNQNEVGEHCYFLVSGKVAIIRDDIEIATIQPLSYFGEASLLSDLPRNATAKATEECIILILNKADFLKLIKKDVKVGKSIFKTQIHRSRPLLVEGTTSIEQINPDGDAFYILKNKDKYFQLSEQGWFIWERINGENTFRDLTMKMYKELNIFDPDFIFQLIISLQVGGFIHLPSAPLHIVLEKVPIWKRFFISLSKLMQFSFVFEGNDEWLGKSFSSFVRYFYKPLVLRIFVLLSIAGLFVFLIKTPAVVNVMSKQDFGFYLLASYLFVLPITVLHELGHAYTVKFYGRDVHAFGIGWFWVGITCFVDTSDMWTATNKQRLLVNSAGIFIELVLAGILSLATLFVDNNLIAGLLWFFSFSIYLSSLLNLCPLFEFDGYYILMGIVNKPNLRVAAITWLANSFQNPTFLNFKLHRAEIIYWISCLLFMLLVAGLLYFIQDTLLRQFFPEYVFNLYVWLLPTMFLIISIITVIIEVNQHKKIHED